MLTLCFSIGLYLILKASPDTTAELENYYLFTIIFDVFLFLVLMLVVGEILT